MKTSLTVLTIGILLLPANIFLVQKEIVPKLLPQEQAQEHLPKRKAKPIKPVEEDITLPSKDDLAMERLRAMVEEDLNDQESRLLEAKNTYTTPDPLSTNEN